MIYLYKCSTDNHEIAVEAKNDKDAVRRITMEVTKHFKQRYAGLPRQSRNELRKIILDKMEKREPAQIEAR